MTGKEKNTVAVQILLLRKGGGIQFSFMQKIKQGHFNKIEKFYCKHEASNPYFCFIPFMTKRER